jgi:hypothetical protein
LLAAFGQSSPTAFPPPLWGRDRERGATSTAFVLKAKKDKGRKCLGSLRTRPALLSVLCRHPSPCPSPTRGEGTLWHGPLQLAITADVFEAGFGRGDERPRSERYGVRSARRPKRCARTSRNTRRLIDLLVAAGSRHQKPSRCMASAAATNRSMTAAKSASV